MGSLKNIPGSHLRLHSYAERVLQEIAQSHTLDPLPYFPPASDFAAANTGDQVCGDMAVLALSFH